MELGANEYLIKRPAVAELENLLKIYLSPNAYESDYALWGNSNEIRKIRSQIVRVAMGGSAAVLITGESGTGKELVARSIHRQGPRRKYSFIDKNCAHSRSELLDDELYGHEKWIATLLRMIDEQPGNRTAVELLLAMEQAMGSTEHRALALERLLTFDLETPVRAQTEHALGLLHYNQGDAASALPHFERAVELEPEAIPIREAHAAALWMLHREAETVAAYQAILELDPRNAQAREALREHEAGTLWDEAPPPPTP